VSRASRCWGKVAASGVAVFGGLTRLLASQVPALVYHTWGIICDTFAKMSHPNNFTTCKSTP
jgi:hypothetical protein